MAGTVGLTAPYLAARPGDPAGAVALRPTTRSASASSGRARWGWPICATARATTTSKSRPSATSGRTGATRQRRAFPGARTYDDHRALLDTGPGRRAHHRHSAALAHAASRRCLRGGGGHLLAEADDPLPRRSAGRAQRRERRPGASARSEPRSTRARTTAASWSTCSSGKLGRIAVARTFNVMNQGSEGLGHPPDAEPPPGLDWERWVGPAPMRPFNDLIVRDAFHNCSFWDFSGGWTPGMAPHIVDLPYWALRARLPDAHDLLGRSPRPARPGGRARHPGGHLADTAT